MGGQGSNIVTIDKLGNEKITAEQATQIDFREYQPYQLVNGDFKYGYYNWNKTVEGSGQANFGEFVLAGVSKDISLIGSIAAYAQIDYVNELIGLQTGDFNAYTLMMADSKTQDLAAFAFESSIAISGLPDFIPPPAPQH